MLNSLQYLRAVASLMVLTFHITNPLRRATGYDGAWPFTYQNGVDVFFVLSGFLMLVATEGRERHAWSFFRKRVIRVAPLYWVVTTVFLAALAVLPGGLAGHGVGIWHVVSSYLFIPARHPSEPYFFPLVTPGWTLNYEMFFYGIWALALLLPGRWRPAAAISALCGLVILGRLLPPRSAVAAVYTSNILLEFVFGLILGLWWLRARTAPVAVGLALLAAGFWLLATLPATHANRVLMWGLPAALVVAGALALEKARAVPEFRWLGFLGDASYSIYIVHVLVMAALERLWRFLPFTDRQGDWIVFALLCFVLSVGAGILTHLYVERPLLQVLGRRATAPAPVPA